MLEKRVGLKNKTGLALVGAFLGDILAAESDLPRVGNLKSRDDAQEGRFAAAAGAEQGEQFPRLHFERNIAQRGHGPLPLGLESLGNMADGDTHNLVGADDVGGEPAPFESDLDGQRDGGKKQ